MSVNDDILQAQVLRDHYIEKFRNFEVKRMSALITETRLSLRRAILEEDLTKWTKKRYKQINKNLIQIQKAGNGRFTEKLMADLQAFGGQEAVAGAGILTDKIPFNVNVRAPSPEQVWSAAMTNPLMMKDGMTVDLGQFVQDFNEKNLQIVQQGLRQGFLRGETTNVIAKNLAGATGVLSKRTADIIVRTATNHMASMARKKVAETNSDIVKGYEWVSVLDRRTTPVCQDNDGRAWFYKEEDRAGYSGLLLNGEVYPPAHMRCRSTITYITRSWQELGIQGIEESPLSTRASMDGQVPASLNYKSWLMLQEPAVIKDVLGATRYAMLEEGNIDVAQFYANDGSMLTLKELEKRGYTMPGKIPSPDPLPKPKGTVYSSFEELDTAMDEAWGNLTPAEKEAVKRYSGSSYKPMNDAALRGQADTDLLSAIEKLPSYEGPTIRRYSTPSFDNMVDKYTSGEWSYWDNKAFSSTALSPKGARGFKKYSQAVDVVIHNTGRNSGGMVGRASSFESELEYLIAPNEEFRVINFFKGGDNRLILEVTDAPAGQKIDLVFPKGTNSDEHLETILGDWDTKLLDALRAYNRKGKLN